MSRLRTKFLYGAAILVVLLILVVTIVFNVLLNLSRARLLAAANAYLSDQIHVGYMAYVFPNFVILKNIQISERNSSAPARRVHIPTATAEFSILEFIARQDVVVQKLKWYHPYIHHGYFRDFLTRNGERLWKFLLELPRADFRFSVKEVFWDLAPGPNYAHLNFVFHLRKDAILLHGSVRKDKYGYAPTGKTPWQRLAVGIPLEFDFKGTWLDDGLLIENLELKRKNIYLKIWGGLDKSQLQLNGFSFIDTYPQEEYQPVNPQRVGRVQAYLRQIHKTPSGVHLEDKDIYVIDVDCRAQLALPNVSLQRLNFTFNDMPMSIKGDLSLKEPFAVDVEAMLDPSRSRTFMMKNLDRAQWHITGAVKDKVFTSNNELYIFFNKAKDPNFPMERIDGSFQGLRFSLDQYARPQAHVRQGDMTFNAGENRQHKLAVEDVRISLNVLNKKLRLLEVQAPFYGGKLAGKVWLTTGPTAPKIDATIALSDVDVSRMDEVLFDFAGADGRLFSRIQLTSVPRLNLNGQWEIYNGQIRQFAFFQWLAETFHLPSLQKVDFQQISSGFYADTDALKFQGIFLKSADVNISGYFDIDKHNLVSSYLSLAFSKGLLGESPKFRPVLKIFGEDIPAVIFDFQLSGMQDAMNFQWLPSAHKSMIQQRIPDFIEGIIERNIHEMIVPPEKQEPAPASPVKP